MRESIATEVADAAKVIEDGRVYLLNHECEVNQERSWAQFGTLVLDLDKQDAFREHATDLHVNIRLAPKRNIDRSVGDWELVAWDECVGYFAKRHDVVIPSGLDPAVEGKFGEKRWLPAMSAVVKGLRELANTLETSQPVDANGPKKTAHAPDFRSVTWFGVEYSFTTMQAACIRVMWESWQQNRNWVSSEVRILEVAGSVSTRMRDVFDKGHHPAWGAMVIQGEKKGTFKLSEDKEP